MEERVGPYLLNQLLASGASGAVHRARHSSTGQEVALKLLKPDLSDDADFVARFRREARAMAALKHPHIVRVFDSGVDNNRYYIAMELLAGGSLQGKLDSLHRARLALPVAQALEITRQIAEALAYAHALGITHRDVKPANVMAAAEGRYVLTDFGIAQMVDATQLTRPYTTLGTPVYMSPEQAQGLPPDGRSDLYSLGVMMFEMLAQRAPFMADSTPALLYKHVHEMPPPLGEEIPGPARALVARLMAKRPDDRPQDAAEVVKAIEGILPRGKPRQRAPARARLAALALTGLAVVFGGLVAMSGDGLNQTRAAPTAAAATRTSAPSVAPTPLSGAPRQAVTTTVYANRDWQPSGLVVRKGETLRIRPLSGAWSECALAGCAFHDAGGDPAAPRAQASNAVQGCAHASLVAISGEGTPFCVGSDVVVRADADGELRLRMNDILLLDNDGSLVVALDARP